MNEGLQQEKIILFDGVCNLCNSSVNFVLRHETGPMFKFASIQSQAGRELSQWCGLPDDYSEAVMLIDHRKFHSGSTAVLKIGQSLIDLSNKHRINSRVAIFLKEGAFEGARVEFVQEAIR